MLIFSSLIGFCKSLVNSTNNEKLFEVVNELAGFGISYDSNEKELKYRNGYKVVNQNIKRNAAGSISYDGTLPLADVEKQRLGNLIGVNINLIQPALNKLEKIITSGDVTSDKFVTDLFDAGLTAEKTTDGKVAYYLKHNNKKFEIALNNKDAAKLNQVEKYLVSRILPSKYNELSEKVHTSNKQVADILFGDYTLTTKKEVLIHLHNHVFNPKQSEPNVLLNNNYNFHEDFESIIKIMKLEHSELNHATVSADTLIQRFHNDLARHQEEIWVPGSLNNKKNPWYGVVDKVKLNSEIKTLLEK
ncbi:MAG: hypothetical protein LBJ67_06860 [Planctomycetaceae bacterium]|jgi:hypothetical protein|nr:hypothetical protein [Planctomycetaceae bacterium]